MRKAMGRPQLQSIGFIELNQEMLPEGGAAHSDINYNVKDTAAKDVYDLALRVWILQV